MLILVANADKLDIYSYINGVETMNIVHTENM